MKIKENTIYNDADNLIYIRSHKDKIFIICKDMKQVDEVQKRLHEAGNIMIDFEQWDEDIDMKYIMTFQLIDGQKPIYN